MFNIIRKEMQWEGRTLTLETGRIARQAHGSVLATYGDTVVLCAVTAERTPRPGLDFFPLTVHYQEKAYAAGRIPGGFFKREARPSEKETLTSRLIDRPIRPLFAPGFKCETQVIATVLSHDMENDPDMLAMIAASAALTISGVPFLGPIANCRVGEIDGELVVNPPLEQMANSTLDLVVAGTNEGVMMVESEAHELSEERMLEAVVKGHTSFQAVIDLIIDLAEDSAKEPWPAPEAPAGQDEMRAKLEGMVSADIKAAYGITEKLARQTAVGAVKAKAIEAIEAEDGDIGLAKGVLKDLEKDIVRNSILDTGKRIDERDTKTVRPIVSEVGVLPLSHGSALFTRGETQGLIVCTLGTGSDEQIMDRLEGEMRERFLLHYNFPPYSVGEAGRMGPPGRREIGHGKLAWRALRPMLPAHEDFPYTIRCVSEITESNGSSSMATVCGGSLAMMDAGVPLKAPVAGIAMGLIKEGDRFAVLSDILGDEDHLGDMDFKVAGTENGITSLQMDIKITSITAEIMQIALDQAKDGRLHILGEMSKGLGHARSEVSSNAPRITTMKVPREKIRDVIGSGGKVIRELVELTGAKIDIEDDGTIKIAATDPAAAEDAQRRIHAIVAEPEAGMIYDGKVVKIMDFGAFVNFLGPKDGLVHISEMRPGRVRAVSDVVSEGDMVKVKCLGFDDRGKVRLTMKNIDQETGEEVTPAAEEG